MVSLATLRPSSSTALADTRPLRCLCVSGATRKWHLTLRRTFLYRIKDSSCLKLKDVFFCVCLTSSLSLPWSWKEVVNFSWTYPFSTKKKNHSPGSVQIHHPKVVNVCLEIGLCGMLSLYGYCSNMFKRCENIKIRWYHSIWNLDIRTSQSVIPCFRGRC